LPRPPLTPINNLPEPSNNIQFKSNTTAQNHLLENLQKVKNDLYEYNNLLRAASTPELRSSFTLKIKKLEETVMQKAVLKENVVEIYDTSGHPLFFIKDPNLSEKMHDCVKFGAADYKR
ncbi:9138_t:CDS:2, partial [Rhizophagus irregularis]